MYSAMHLFSLEGKVCSTAKVITVLAYLWFPEVRFCLGKYCSEIYSIFLWTEAHVHENTSEGRKELEIRSNYV